MGTALVSFVPKTWHLAAQQAHPPTTTMELIFFFWVLGSQVNYIDYVKIDSESPVSELREMIQQKSALLAQYTAVELGLYRVSLSREQLATYAGPPTSTSEKLFPAATIAEAFGEALEKSKVHVVVSPPTRTLYV